ncbi:MAG: hydroxymethylglutaryl-CoA lyase [Boseongicola sp. SB0676_bin_33]|uniref:hydroxymethylglutaryl-CoA lyase n=1 Tax=Boseongicola sp. SB0664_bin_43 TaxID=2604844 RepID=A0A6B0Y3R3_9RHOB|nr:hydroxymethylglutaryl-CoA lyase [Boseongicola sp. SB0664_bin_43]MYF89626.1 hydroxymethylglutaryl-CoA lyase [Boseongicola sp. SB0676_bin_33]
MSDRVLVFEMAPRDGLQNEARVIPTEDKIALVDALTRSGFKKIETASFVSPKWVPQMADGAEVMAGINRRTGVAYTALTPNMKGFEGALAAGADEVAVFGAASETFSRMNVNCSISESYERFRPIMDRAAAEGVPVRGYVSCVTDCPYEGKVAPEAVAAVARALLDMGCYEISLGDTIGKGTPESVSAMLDAVLSLVPAERIAGHFHDTDGRALANILAALALGIRTFDASAGGIGGCPYATGAQGNVATEAVVGLLEAEGFETGVDPDALGEAARFAQRLGSG